MRLHQPAHVECAWQVCRQMDLHRRAADAAVVVAAAVDASEPHFCFPSHLAPVLRCIKIACSDVTSD